MDFDLQLAIRCTDAFSIASGIGCALSETNGEWIHTSGYSCACCQICRRAGKQNDACISSRKYGLQASERFGGKYIYFCAMGLTCFTSPILGPNGSIAQLTVGPFMMVDETDYSECELKDICKIDEDIIQGIMEEVKKIPYIEANRVTALSELLFMSVAFINNVSETNRLMEKEEAGKLQGQITDYILRMKREEVASSYPYRNERRFLQALSQGETEQSRKLLNELLGHIMFSSGGNLQVIRDKTYDLLVLISRTAMDAGADPFYIEEEMRKYRLAAPAFSSVDELSLRLSRLVRSFMDAIFANRNAKHTDLMYRAIQYLRINFSEKITLDDVAHHVYMSPTYLSRIFKRETGSSLVDYLNRIRIEKSKELMEDNHIRMIDIALQCGFESQSYFNRVFKQLTGVTPQQYRKKLEIK